MQTAAATENWDVHTHRHGYYLYSPLCWGDMVPTLFIHTKRCRLMNTRRARGREREREKAGATDKQRGRKRQAAVSY